LCLLVSLLGAAEEIEVVGTLAGKTGGDSDFRLDTGARLFKLLMKIWTFLRKTVLNFFDSL
jgi:hypothetical protein